MLIYYLIQQKQSSHCPKMEAELAQSEAVLKSQYKCGAYGKR